MNFNFTPQEVIYNLDEEIRNKVYTLYDKYLKSKTQSSLHELLEFIYSNPNVENRREFFDLKITEDKTVFDYFLEQDGDLDEENAKFIAQNDDYVIKGLLKGKYRIGDLISEEVLFKEIEGKTLLEHLINNPEFRAYMLTNIKTRKEAIEILRRNNQERLLQYLGEELLFEPYNENQTVIEYLIENNMYNFPFLTSIQNHPEIYDILIKNNLFEYLRFLTSRILMTEREGKTLLESLLDSGIHPVYIEIINEDLIKILLKYNLEIDLSAIPLEYAFIDVDGSDKKLLEYLTAKGVLCYNVVQDAIDKNQNLKEIIDILEKHNKLFMIQNLPEESLLQTYGRNETLLETLIRNNVTISNANVTKKETFDLLVADNRYDELCRSSEEMLLQTLPNGRKLYEELIIQQRYIKTENINNEEIVNAILNQSDIRLVHCIGIEMLLSNYSTDKTYLDLILEYAKNQNRKILGHLRFEDATLNEQAKIIIAHTRHGFLNMLSKPTKKELLDDSQGTSLLEELLREDEKLTLNYILSNDLISDVEIATILKMNGLQPQTITYDEEYNANYAKKYIQAKLNSYKTLQVTEEQEKQLKELYNTMNDGMTPIEIIDMMVASYRYLCATNNPYAQEIMTIIEMKKNNPEFHIEYTTEGASYSSDKKTIYLDDLNIQVFHHELGHAFFHMNNNKNVPDGFIRLMAKMEKSKITELKLENYHNRYSKTSHKISMKISHQLKGMEKQYDTSEVERYLSSFTDGLAQRLIARGYNPSLVEKVLGQNYSVNEFVEQQKKVAHGEMLDAMIRIESSIMQSLGDYFDGIYKGDYHDGKITGIFSGTKLKGGYGHGRNYYSQRSSETVFNEMIANFSANVKLEGLEPTIKIMEKYLGKELTNMVLNSYNKMVLQNIMVQTINQSQTINPTL